GALRAPRLAPLSIQPGEAKNRVVGPVRYCHGASRPTIHDSPWVGYRDPGSRAKNSHLRIQQPVRTRTRYQDASAALPQSPCVGENAGLTDAEPTATPSQPGCRVGVSPVADNTSPEGKQQNRRVELVRK